MLGNRIHCILTGQHMLNIFSWLADKEIHLLSKYHNLLRIRPNVMKTKNSIHSASERLFCELDGKNMRMRDCRTI